MDLNLDLSDLKLSISPYDSGLDEAITESFLASRMWGERHSDGVVWGPRHLGPLLGILLVAGHLAGRGLLSPFIVSLCFTAFSLVSGLAACSLPLAAPGPGQRHGAGFINAR